MKHFFLTILLLSITNAFTQTGRSIEVTVTDTMTLKALSGKFFITIEMDESDYGEEYYEDEYYGEEEYSEGGESEEYYEEWEGDSRKSRRQIRKAQKRSKKQMEAILKEMEEMPMAEEVPQEEEVMMNVPEDSAAFAEYTSEEEIPYPSLQRRRRLWIEALKANNISFDTLAGRRDSDPYDEYSENYEEGYALIEVTATDTNQIKTIHQYLDSIKGSSISVQTIQFESASQKMEEVYKDLYKKAQAESLLLAKVIGGTPGKVLRIFEAEAGMGDLFKIYEDANLRMRESRRSNKMNDKEVVVERTFVFELK